VARAQTRVDLSGDFRLYLNSWARYYSVGWDTSGKMSAQSLFISERFRLRADFASSDNLKFRVQIRVNDAAWGHDLAIDKPPTDIDVSNAYLASTLPDTAAACDIGWQDWTNPQSAFFDGGLVLDTQVAALRLTERAVPCPALSRLDAVPPGRRPGVRPRDRKPERRWRPGGNSGLFPDFGLRFALGCEKIAWPVEDPL
jgi:hypothetical protein